MTLPTPLRLAAPLLAVALACGCSAADGGDGDGDGGGGFQFDVNAPTDLGVVPDVPTAGDDTADDTVAPLDVPDTTGPDSGTDADTDTVADSDTGTDPDTVTVTDPDTTADPDTDTDTATDPDAATGPDTFTDPDSDTDPDTTTAPDTTAAPDTDTDPDADAGPCQTNEDCAGEDVGTCQLAICDVPSGDCVGTPAPDSWPCDDKDPCTEGSLCLGGKCNPDLGVVRDCDDNNPCTFDGCDASQPDADVNGCVHLGKQGGCSDGNSCTAGDQCADGFCQGVPTAACGCVTDDDCNAFEDGNLCNGKLACVAGSCALDPATIVVCDDPTEPCTVLVCDPKKGQCGKQLAPDGAWCDDGEPCSKDDACLGGVCEAGEAICECVDDIDCAVFDDGNLCTGVFTCQGGACAVQPGSAVTCPPVGGCLDNVCVPGTGACQQQAKPIGAPCEDGNLCTVGEACFNNLCSGGVLNTCDDGNPCTQDFCVPGQGCNNKLVNDQPCEDGNKCTAGELCVAGVCGGGAPVECDDGNACTVNSCDPAEGCVTTQLATPCDDGNACTTGEACSNGSCTGGVPANCNDGNPCTDDSCDAATGCQNVDGAGFCDTGDFCTSPGQCKSGQCTPGPNKCVDCQADADCLAQDDGNLCNGAPKCVAGTCVDDPNSAVQCSSDGDTACVLSFCNPLTGLCQKAAAPTGTACDDGDACTAQDVCSVGICQAGVPVDGPGCPGSVCGDGYCDPAKNEDCKSCVADCGSCFNECGDGKCAFLDLAETQPENCSNCPADCGACGAGCEPSGAAFCGSVIAWATNFPGATDGLDSLAGACGGSLSGNEFTYAFVPACSGPTTITVTPVDPKQVLGLALLDGDQGCSGASCLQATAPATTPGTISAELTQDKLYYLVVDSQGAAGKYGLEVDCACAGPKCGDNLCTPGAETCKDCPQDCGACPVCGDGQCIQGKEDCTICAADCGPCAGCGDGICLQGSEDCVSCAADCGACPTCGDGKCLASDNEDCKSCEVDCGACPTTCQPNNQTLTCGSTLKGAMAGVGSTDAIDAWQCNPGNFSGPEQAYLYTPSCSGFSVVKVVRDPGQAGTVDIHVVAANKTCDGSTCLASGTMVGDTATASFASTEGVPVQIVLDSPPGSAAAYTVSVDCVGCASGCGNQQCDGGETCESCPLDCGLCKGCGDNICEGNETCQTCQADCGACPFCGDGQCNAGETCQTCTKDCGVCGAVCGDGNCDPAEDCNGCPGDCGACPPPDNPGCAATPTPGCDGCSCEACVCANDPFCCDPAGAWTDFCVSLCKFACPNTCD